MASFQLVGYIDTIKYIKNGGGCFVFVSEFKKGYKKKDGTVVEDKYHQWKCIFKQGLVKYITEHFGNGMLVEIKGEVLPFAKEGDKLLEGYSVIGQCINMASYPRAFAKQEYRMIKESLSNSDEKPDLEGFNERDF